MVSARAVKHYNGPMSKEDGRWSLRIHKRNEMLLLSCLLKIYDICIPMLFEFRISWSRVLLDNLPNFLFIGDAILLEEIVCISLSWRFRVGLIQKRLNAK